MTYLRAPLLACLALAIGTCSPASAQAPPATSTPSAVEAPRLLATRSGDDLADFYPPVAQARAQTGQVDLDCVVQLDTSAVCSVVTESVPDMGFGEAALRFSHNWRFSPGTVNGQPVADAHKRIQINFVMDGLQIVPLGRGLAVTARRVDAASAAAEPPPTPGQIRFYPDSARHQGIEGRVIVACAVRSDRRVECGIDREAPSGWSFGSAALQIVERLIAERPATAPPFAPNYVFRLPVDFQFTDTQRGAHRPDAPAWAETPEEADFSRAYPRQALNSNLPGRAELVCTIRADRRLNCEVSGETPEGQGFGAAALAVAQNYVVAEREIGPLGFLVGDRIILPITFAIGN